MITGLKEAVGATAAIVIIVLLIIAAGAGLSVAGYEINAWMSAPVGAAKVKTDTNDAQNRETAQYQFGQDYNAIQADVANIKQDTANYYQQGKSNYLLNLVTQDQQACRNDITAYNALADGTTTGPWRPAEDPASYDQSATCAMPSQ